MHLVFRWTLAAGMGAWLWSGSKVAVIVMWAIIFAAGELYALRHWLKRKGVQL